MGSSSSKAANAAPRRFPRPTATASLFRQLPNQPASRDRPCLSKNAGKTRLRILWNTNSLSSIEIRVDAVGPDAINGDFSRRLQQMGNVHGQPTFSPILSARPEVHVSLSQPLGPSYPASANNTTIEVLEARGDLQRKVQAEFEDLDRRSSRRREFVDLNTVVRVLKLREIGVPAARIEAQLDLKSGVIGKLGPVGTAIPASLLRN
jgi:hypothetical protein